MIVLLQKRRAEGEYLSTFMIPFHRAYLYKEGMKNPDHAYWMTLALQEAALAASHGDVPVGAVLVDRQGQVISQAHNRRELDHDPTAHAEILVLRQGAAVCKDWRLTDCTLYVTLEPCAMCAGAILHARLGLLVYGADDPKAGAIRSVLNLPDSPLSFHRLPTLGGIQEEACRTLLRSWFQQQRPNH
jgi:tRNA(adenine34) deaminase